MSDFIPMELDDYMDPIDPVEEAQEDIINEIIDESIDEPSNIEPEPIADYSEGEIIGAEDIQDEVISDVTEDVVEETTEEDFTDDSVSDEIFEEAYAVDVVEEPKPNESVLEEPTEPEEEYVDSFERYSRVGTRETPYEYSNGGEVTNFVPTLLR